MGSSGEGYGDRQGVASSYVGQVACERQFSAVLTGSVGGVPAGSSPFASGVAPRVESLAALRLDD